MNAAHKKAPGVNGGDVLVSSQPLNHSAPSRRPQPPNAHTARRRLSAYMRNKNVGQCIFPPRGAVTSKQNMSINHQ